MIRWNLRYRVLPAIGALLSAAFLLALSAVFLLALYVAAIFILSILLGASVPPPNGP